MEGEYFYDYPNQKSRFSFEKVHLTVDQNQPERDVMKTTIQTARRHLAEIDLGHSLNAVRDHMLDIDVLADGVNVLRYDQGKNFTWGTNEEGNKECTCEDLDSTMNPLYLPPGAEAAGLEDITLMLKGGETKKIQAKKYTIDLSRGPSDYLPSGRREDDGMPSLDMAFYLINDKLVSFRVSMDMMIMKIVMNTDFDEITLGMPDMEIFEADPDLCVCPEKPEADTTDDFVPCDADVKGCTCSKKLPVALEFCTDVDWNIDPALDTAATDNFAKGVVESSVWLLETIGSKASDKCKEDLKTFLCTFYFSLCSEGGVIKLPEQHDLSSCGDAIEELQKGTAGDGRREDKAKSNKAQSPHQAYRTNISDDKKDKKGGHFFAIVMILVLGGAVAGGRSEDTRLNSSHIPLSRMPSSA
eukprot:TRINITY_DN2401_c0_g1_i5.p1 TRINITY_DN2401_c0_g1~~TRINITY_DN2401_c0_g1_i5.p1  ORF type:complete len:469 (+),score=153.33 TRINITY_DN2401_c0_g1_i5:169-1407(+)